MTSMISFMRIRYAARRLSAPLATLGGCASMDQNVRTVEAKVLPITMGQVAEVSICDLARRDEAGGFLIGSYP